MNNKGEILRVIKEKYLHPSLLIEEVNEEKPWGAYYRVANKCAGEFIRLYFDETTVNKMSLGGELSPKILVFEPGNSISLQYHQRRAEVWRVISGKLLAYMSDDDNIGDRIEYPEGAVVSYGPFIRHKAGAPDGSAWTVVAEIWQHTDSSNLSDEDDIVRIQDDYGRA